MERLVQSILDDVVAVWLEKQNLYESLCAISAFARVQKPGWTQQLAEETIANMFRWLRGENSVPRIRIPVPHLHRYRIVPGVPPTMTAPKPRYQLATPSERAMFLSTL